MEEAIIKEAITGILLLVWIALGIGLAHKCRRSGVVTHLALSFFCTKGYVLYWICYGLPSLLVRGVIKLYRYKQEQRETESANE